jgi:hypothetical protein
MLKSFLTIPMHTMHPPSMASQKHKLPSQVAHPSDVFFLFQTEMFNFM